MEAQSSLPAACFYPDKILVLSAVQCEVLMHVQCMAETQRSELKEQIHNDTNTRMTQTSGNTIRSVVSQMVVVGGNWAADTRRSHLALVAWREWWKGQ